MSNLFNKIKELQNKPKAQRGAALMVMLVIVVVGAAAMLLSALNSSAPQLARAKITADALAQAKEALIGYAAGIKISLNERPGDLPCPDLNNDGVADGPCGDSAGSNQNYRLGRLPWKSLGLPDLRDGSGERLWYAVSNNFKNNSRTLPLNSDTTGTITVRSSDGNIVNDASAGKGVVAVILAPGPVLKRQGDPLPQNRSCAIGVDCNAQDKCTTAAPYTATPKCNPVNYLDKVTIGANTEDNADFSEIITPSNGFIQGPIKDNNGITILNDQILVITQDNIMLPIQNRVAREVVNALNFYYSFHYFYPSPAAFSDALCLGNGNLASCNSAALTGRIPANPATAWDATSILRGSISNNWFQANGWREVIYYAVATTCTDGTTNCGGASGNLTLNNPPGASLVNQKVVVIATGNALATQNHSVGNQNTLSNYLEDENLSPLDDIYTSSASTPFNDIAVSIP